MVFTGLIEEIGTITDITQDASTQQTILTIHATDIFHGMMVGDSICTNGVCLTVTSFDTHKQLFTVGLSPETLQRTNFSTLLASDLVNLERSITVETRLGGHVVQGHVDCTGIISALNVDKDMLVVTIHIDKRSDFAYIVEKGYITIDGTSLTVTHIDLNNLTFSVMLIQYTQSKIILSKKKVGDLVNLEFDILGKYFVNYMNIFSDKIAIKQ